MNRKKILIFMEVQERKETVPFWPIRLRQRRSSRRRSGKLFPHEMNVRPCDACDVCRSKTETDCILDDDMRDLFPKLRQATESSSPARFTGSRSPLRPSSSWTGGMLWEDPRICLKGKKFGIVMTYADEDPSPPGRSTLCGLSRTPELHQRHHCRHGLRERLGGGRD